MYMHRVLNLESGEVFYCIDTQLYFIKIEDHWKLWFEIDPLIVVIIFQGSL